jgi:hypothetical protein
MTRALWQRKTLPAEDRVFQRGERRLTLKFQMRHAAFCSRRAIQNLRLISCRLRGSGQGAGGPLYGVGLERINFIAQETLKPGPAIRCRDRLHAFCAMRATCGVHRNLPVFPINGDRNKSSLQKFLLGLSGESSMQTAIDRVMHTYGLIVNLTPEEERNIREKVSIFLATAKTEDETKLAVEGLRYLRSSK